MYLEPSVETRRRLHVSENSREGHKTTFYQNSAFRSTWVFTVDLTQQAVFLRLSTENTDTPSVILFISSAFDYNPKPIILYLTLLVIAERDCGIM